METVCKFNIPKLVRTLNRLRAKEKINQVGFDHSTFIDLFGTHPLAYVKKQTVEELSALLELTVSLRGHVNGKRAIIFYFPEGLKKIRKV